MQIVVDGYGITPVVNTESSGIFYFFKFISLLKKAFLKI